MSESPNPITVIAASPGCLLAAASHGQTRALDADYTISSIDSLFMMNLVTYLEQQHQVEFGMNDMVPENFRPINALSAFARGQ